MTETVTSQDDSKTQTPSSPKTNKSKAVKQTGDGSDRPKTIEKVEKPPTKVVVRRLPPTMILETFLDQVAPLPPVDYMYFVKADSSLSPNSFGRAYLHFIHVSDLLIFTEKFDNYVFVDSKGNEYPAIVEYAPFQRIPKQRPSRKKDPRIGTIENDPYYLEFMEALKAEETQRKSASKSNKQHFFETSTSLATPKVTSTPLLEYLKARRADKLRTKEDKIAERKKREIERRKAREDAVIKPPQPSSDTTTDLAEIQTRYLRCMIGLDKDTSALEQVSCCACCSPDVHAPFNCQVLRERMHLLLLHISPPKKLPNPDLKTEVLNIPTQQISVHQLFQSVKADKPCSTAEAIVVSAQPPLSLASLSPSPKQANRHPVCTTKTSLKTNQTKPLCSLSVEPKLIQKSTLLNKSIKPKVQTQLMVKESSFKTQLQKKNETSTVPISSTESEKVIHGQPLQFTLPSEVTFKPCLVKKDVAAVTNMSSKDVLNEMVKGPMKLTEFFKLLESGHLQAQYPAVSNFSTKQMTTLQELEKHIIGQQEEGNSEKKNCTEFDESPSHSTKCSKIQHSLPAWKKPNHYGWNGNQKNERFECQALQCQEGKNIIKFKSPYFFNQGAAIVMLEPNSHRGLLFSTPHAVTINETNRGKVPMCVFPKRFWEPTSSNISTLKRKNSNSSQNISKSYSFRGLQNDLLDKSNFYARNISPATSTLIGIGNNTNRTIHQMSHRILGPHPYMGWKKGGKPHPIRRMSAVLPSYPFSMHSKNHDSFDNFHASPAVYRCWLPYSTWRNRF
ncbi:uncharacterized protein LOC113204599 isoform X2 [Frankliniella occidentalis]|uniref:Uncharacterized protein LOC113204599 isoform X2 n=1 Tax=Frankliniella occidentalis TaxID=133901 RepID=A0A6J1SA79_FRAOC|nr:uncharacterized protein LOC113204599 isoform X2 [Frankliniella occidentalis]